MAASKQDKARSGTDTNLVGQVLLTECTMVNVWIRV